MKKKWTALLPALALSLALSLALGVSAAAADVSVSLNGVTLRFGAFAPEIEPESGYTYLPLRQVFEALGCASEDITWDPATQTAAAKRGDRAVSLTVGSTEALIAENGETRTEVMDAAPYMKTDENGSGYVYVPVRFAARALGCGVEWDNETRTVLLTDDSLSAPQPQPDAEGTVSFENLDARVRSGNLTVLMLQENIDAAEDVDYQKAEDELRDKLNEIAGQQWQALQMPMGMGEMMNASLQAQYDALRENFDALRNGEVQQDAADQIRQLKDTQDQVVLTVESIYIQLDALETQKGSYNRQLAALDRQIEEVELRHALGQVSDLQLLQLKAGRAGMASAVASLETAIRSLKFNLEAMLGEELTGEIDLEALPAVTARQIGNMDLEADLASARAASFDLYSAKNTLDDAEETYKDTASDHGYNERSEEFRRARHVWQAAQYAYESTVQTFELKFRTLYDQVKNDYQLWQTAGVALENQQAVYAAEELKLQLGTISRNALLSAQDDLQAARESVSTAANGLFSSYNNYRWAVGNGILN